MQRINRRQSAPLRMGIYGALLPAILLGLSSPRLRSADWPQWRGPTQDGLVTEEDLADAWPEDGPPVLWTRELGQGYSAFVVVNGRAYTQTQSLYDQSLVCLDAETGATLWSHRYGWPFDGGGLYPGPRATPAVAEGRVYFAAPNGLIDCVQADTGAPIWSVNLKERHRGRGTDFGVSASPVVWRGRVFVPVGGPKASLVALDADTGDVLWKCGELPASYATPIVVPFEERWLVIAPLENSLLCADAETGERLWELDLSAGYDEHSAAPLYREPFLMLAGPFSSGAKCVRLVADAEPPGCHVEPVWDSLKFSNDIASSVLLEDHVYGFDLKDPQSRLHRPSRGEFRCLNWSDGKVQWSSSEPGHANCIGAGDKLLLFNDRGELRLCRASPAGYQELAQATVFSDEICWTPPALSEGRVFLRTQTRAACLYIGQKPYSSQQPVQTIAAIPRVSRWDPTSWVGGEREFPAATPEWDELKLWYAWTMAALGSAWVVAWIVAAASFLPFRPPTDALMIGVQNRRKRSLRMSIYWMGIVVCGAFGSAILNPRLHDFIFTWPLALWGLMQLATEASVSAVLHPADRRRSWLARGKILLLIIGCGLYFHLCRRMGLATEWSFLTGYMLACPVTMLLIWSARRFHLPDRWITLPVHLCSYSLYFWGSVLFMKWRMQVGS